MTQALHISHLNNATEDAAAPYLRAVTTPTRDQIRERINLFTAIPSAARAVLIEVCTLVELGGKGRCFASNKLLSERACCAEMTVSKHLQVLIKIGLIVRTYANNDHSKRDLAPSTELIEAYRTDGGLSGVLKGVKWGTERGLSRVRKGVKRGTYQIESTKEDKGEYLNPSYVAELETQLAEMRQELNAAYAASTERGDKILELTTELTKLKRRATKPAIDPRPIAERFAAEAAGLDEEATQRWERFCKWEASNPLPNVYALKDPLRPAELTKLVQAWDGNAVKNILVEMENHVDICKKKSAYLTANNWLERGRARQEKEDARQEQATARYRLTNPIR